MFREVIKEVIKEIIREIKSYLKGIVAYLEDKYESEIIDFGSVEVRG